MKPLDIDIREQGKIAYTFSMKELGFVFDLLCGMNFDKAQRKNDLSDYEVAYVSMKINLEIGRRKGN